MYVLAVILIVTSSISVFTGIFINLMRNKYVAGLKKASEDRKEAIAKNYLKQVKLMKFALWLTPLYLLLLFLFYEFVPLTTRALMNGAIIIILFLSGAVLNLSFKSFVLNSLKKN